MIIKEHIQNGLNLNEALIWKEYISITKPQIENYLFECNNLILVAMYLKKKKSFNGQTFGHFVGDPST